MSKISSQDIADGASVTRQTLYRNFQDKYAIVNWHFEVLVKDSFAQLINGCSLQTVLEKKFNYIANEITFFMEAFKSQDYALLIEYDYRHILNFYTDIITKKIGVTLPDDIAFSLEMYCRG